ncbi:Abhydrolase domain-containing protein 4 [Orchesella cincta]|uniref:Abhydrolase domain-containing protein 4 n=1 Tax=Orchesella cincta TaxID=48709 RepID=A0A1D2M4Q1_ORCCI|nr:Abhydrolase domain-containing protein 4 [Orchesella cincta]
MIMLGHSMGAFLVFSYALKYPHRVAHMIFADPWGFSEKPVDLSQLTHIPTTHRMIVKVLDSLPLNPLWTVRLMGPMGAELIKRRSNGSDLKLCSRFRRCLHPRLLTTFFTAMFKSQLRAKLHINSDDEYFRMAKNPLFIDIVQGLDSSEFR